MANGVRILNPGMGSGWASPAQAERYVRLGQAIMTDEGLMFRAHSRISVDIRQETQGAGGIATDREMRALPLLRPQEMLVVRTAPKAGSLDSAERSAHVAAAASRAKAARAGGLAGVLAAMRANKIAGPSRP
jgi:hypothetical protein